MNETIDELLREWENDMGGGNWATGSTVTYSASAPVPVAKPPDPLETASDADLILELVKRGYAVGRLNDENKLEEVK